MYIYAQKCNMACEELNNLVLGKQTRFFLEHNVLIWWLLGENPFH